MHGFAYHAEGALFGFVANALVIEGQKFALTVKELAVTPDIGDVTGMGRVNNPGCQVMARQPVRGLRIQQEQVGRAPGCQEAAGGRIPGRRRSLGG